MRRHDCSGDGCGYCLARIDAAENERDFPTVDEWGAEAAARDMVFGRWDA